MYSERVRTIENAADFLKRFRQMPRNTQDSVRGYLASSLKLALSVLDSCSVNRCTTSCEI